MKARGVDQNLVVAEKCRERGSDVDDQEAVEHLPALTPALSAR
jgi:hypothetical protein